MDTINAAEAPMHADPRSGRGIERLPLFAAGAPQGLRAGVSVTLDGLRHGVARCRSCPLYGTATQAAFGEGPRDARLMLVGEQPGDPEDVAGRPIAGAARQMLDQALAEAGIAREAVYVTNAVKHFKFVSRGRRRIQQKAGLHEITACRFWLDHEIALVKPSLIVALGASAGRALLGRGFAAGAGPGRLYSLPSCVRVAVTVHPSDILRMADPARRAAEYAGFVADLMAAQARIAEMYPTPDVPMLAMAS
jgi:DNA polymerase